ncbi:hypothetical protein ACJMK2_005992 [Sinanodonta woodiana]|uniref:Uncharacterized protein n=1 Tax=Sinanodonta woodiana TaxID=1069815 RepID=A0ABD3VRS6_SINWO
MDKNPQKYLPHKVNRYELLCVEKAARKETGPDDQKIAFAFEALDDIIPHLGVYTRIFKRLRDDFYDAVYSEDLTTQGESIMRIPYFLHIQRSTKEQRSALEEMEEQLDIVKKSLFDKHKQYEESQQHILDLKETINKLNNDIDDWKLTVVNKDAEIDRLEEELNTNKEKAVADYKHQQGDIADLKEALEESKEEIEFLSKYKKLYDDLYYAFLDNPSDEIPKKKKRPVVSTKRANLMANIESAQKLEEQIMSVLNTAVEEFDRFLEEHKEELQKLEIIEGMTDAELEAQEIDIDNADQQLESVQDRFKNTIGDITNELLLLKQHSTMLMEQLQTLEQSHPTLMKKLEKRQQEQQSLIKSDSILSAGLGEDNEEDDSDPFIPQERVFSKYAAMLYTSNNQGRSFEEFKDAKFCPSCGEKTVICPHKLPGGEKIFVMPVHSTHIKIVRPKVKINKELMQELMKRKNEEMDATFDLSSTAESNSMVSRELSLQAQESRYKANSPNTAQESPSLMGNETRMQWTVHKLFDDYKTRTNLERSIPRHLSLERTLSVIEQFWTYVIWRDDHGNEQDIHLSVLDKLYSYMEDRYVVEDVTFLCAYDFIASLVEYADSNKIVQLLGHVLVGNLQGATFRYLLLMCDFICAVDWKEVEDFRAFAAVVYPFLGEDDLETLQMSYTSFSENKISCQLVAHFLIHLILKYREPRFLDMENRLIPFQSADSHQPAMSEKEFKDAVDNILPLANDKLRRKLFFEAEKLLRLEGFANSVPIMKLAQIASYLALLQITTVIKETIQKRVKEWRERPSSSGSTRVVHEHEVQVVQSDERLITMSTIRILTTNITRRNKLREQRYELAPSGPEW